MLPKRLQPWFDVVLAQLLQKNPKRFSRQVFEHHVVMASLIKRPLLPWEVVHHRNGKRADNRPGNLRLYKRGEHHPGYGDFYQEWQEALAENARIKAHTASTERH